jgi:transposase-like protein
MTNERCPFCGSRAYESEIEGVYNIGCKKCNISFTSNTPEKCQAKWNTRNDPVYQYFKKAYTLSYRFIEKICGLTHEGVAQVIKNAKRNAGD